MWPQCLMRLEIFSDFCCFLYERISKGFLEVHHISHRKREKRSKNQMRCLDSGDLLRNWKVSYSYTCYTTLFHPHKRNALMKQIFYLCGFIFLNSDHWFWPDIIWYLTMVDQGLFIHFRFDSFEEHIKMKLFLLLFVLVQTNAFRVPLPYGTGVASSGQGKGHQGIWTWFADENSVQQVQGK